MVNKKDSCSVNIFMNEQSGKSSAEGVGQRSGLEGRPGGEDGDERSEFLLAELSSKSPEVLERIFNSLPDMIAILDTHFRIVRINLALADKMGIVPAEAVGLKCYELVHGRDTPAAECPHLGLLEDGREHSAIICEEGLGGACVITVSPLHDPEGRLIGAVHTTRDISEQMRIKEQWSQLEKIKAIGRLAGGISHDFNNILAGIVGYTALLKQSCPSESDAFSDLESIERLVMRGAELSRALLIYSRRGKFSPVELKVNDLVEEVLAVVRRTMGKGLEIDIQLASGLPEISGDREHLYQAVMNLCLNAVDAMDQSGVLTIVTSRIMPDTVFFQKRPYLKAGPFVTISVSDSGSGIEAETRQLIFEPFFTTKSPRPGKGLGLSMVVGIAGQHGGCIEVESEPGRGSTFTLFLPIAGSDIAAVPAVQPPPASKGSILIIDDEDDFRFTLSRWLKGCGYDVLDASGAKQALNILGEKREAIALVLLDMVMEGMDGVETFRELRKLRPDLPVIICSGGPLDESCRELLKEGARDFIQKPFAYRVVVDKLRDIIQSEMNLSTEE